MVTLRPEQSASRTPLPNDHVKAIIELLREGTPDLARRWLAALLLVPAGERAGVVAAVESSIVREYASAPDEQVVRLVHPARELDGFVEQQIVTYTPAPRPTRPKPSRRGTA